MNYLSIIGDNFKLSINAYSKAHSIIWKNGFWKFFIYPALISTVFFITTFSLAMVYSQGIVDWIFTYIPHSTEIAPIDFLQNILYFILSIAIKIMFLLVYFSLFRNIIMILLAPVMAYLAEKTAIHLGFETGKFRWNIFLKNSWRGALINAQNLSKELFLTLILFLFSFIPGLGLIAPFILIMVQCYFYGFSMLDYSMELKSYSIKQSLNFMQKNKSLAISIGGVFYAFFLIPYIGWIFAPVYGTVAATIAMFNKIK
ncbi:MAG: EI24 domain-containing protein [Bacteroidia bacterium]